METNIESFKSLAMVSVSAEGDPLSSYPIDLSSRKLKDLYGDRIELRRVHGNSEGLPRVYNSHISSVGSSRDYIAFVHDDVKIQDLFFLEKLQLAHERLGFDVVGVAGTKDINFKRSHTWGWHTLSAPLSWSGCVGHPADPNSDKIRYSSFGPVPSRAIAIDGLFISCKTSIFSNPKVRFDEDFTFDFYDMSFCFRCHTEGLKIGTIDISCVHQSHGGGIAKETYKDAQRIFNEKYVEKLQGRA